MGWWKRITAWQRGNTSAKTRPMTARRSRVHQFETMEPRILFAADALHIGVTYLENDTGSDSAGDAFEILFEGGAPGTQLRQVVIDTDRGANGLSDGDLIFDTQAGGLGADHAFDLEVLSQTGIDSVQWKVVDGGTRLEFNFTGFDAGEKFVFHIDVDEVQTYDPSQTDLERANEDIDPITSGVEFQGSHVTAKFTAPNYFEATATGEFRNQYDPLFVGTNLLLSSGNANGLANDDYLGKRDRSTGVAASVTQDPFPAAIEGYVYHDANNDGVFDVDENPIAGVTVKLLDANGNVLQKQQTEINGYYRFGGLERGTYSVVESQPADFLDGKDTPGTIDGVPVGDATTDDQLADIVLTEGDTAVEYNFGELLPGSIAGNVFVDEDADCLFDSNETPLKGVVVELLNEQGIVIATTTTDANGAYRFENLTPGKYAVRELQPDGYLQGGQMLGSHGGDDSTVDLLASLVVGSGEHLTQYNFCEIEPASIEGQVFVDPNGNCVLDAGEEPLDGVVIVLLNEQGERVGRTLTDAEGKYRFENLTPGKYSVREAQPADYFQGGTMAGSEGGDVRVDYVRNILLRSGTRATHYDFCEIPPATISGTVFRDGPAIATKNGVVPANLSALRDGKLTDDDVRLAGVVLELRNSLDGLPVYADETLADVYGPGPIRVTTDADGHYEFVGLKPGSYAVVEIQPEGLVDSIDTAGTKGGLAINPDGEGVPPLILTTFSNLGVDLKNDAILRIPLGAGEHAAQNNFSEVLIESLPPRPRIPRTTTPPKLYEPPEATPTPVTPFVPNLPQVTPLNVFLPTPEEEVITGGDSGGYTWHLSVTDGGHPRVTEYGTDLNATPWRIAAWRNNAKLSKLRDDEWALLTAEGEKLFHFGHADAIPFAGDFDGDGRAEIGMYHEGEWFIDLNGNGRLDEGDLWARLGTKFDRPVVGDWDGDGKDDIGIFGPRWYGDEQQLAHEPGLPDVANVRRARLKNVPPVPAEATNGGRQLQASATEDERVDLIDHVFQFGIGTDVPVVGDWNGDGISTPAIFRNGQWHFDMDGDGQPSAADERAQFGTAGWQPVVGDWNGDGRDDIGIFQDGEWILDSNGDRVLDAADTRLQLGRAGDRPVVGDFNADGVDEPAVYSARPKSPSAKPAQETSTPVEGNAVPDAASGETDSGGAEGTGGGSAGGSAAAA